MPRIGRASTIFLVGFLLAELFFTYTSVSLQRVALPPRRLGQEDASWWHVEELLHGASSSSSVQQGQIKSSSDISNTQEDESPEATLFTRTDDPSSSSTLTTVLSDSKPGKPFLVLVRSIEQIFKHHDAKQHSPLTYSRLAKNKNERKSVKYFYSTTDRPRRARRRYKMKCRFGKIKFCNSTMSCTVALTTFLEPLWDDSNCNWISWT